MGKLKLLALAGMMLLFTVSGACGELARLTAYNENERDSRPYGHLNCQGGRLEVGQCAADLRYHHLNESVHIEGMGTFIVSDCGSAIVGRNRFDIYVGSMRECNEFGVQYKEVSYGSHNKVANQDRKSITKRKKMIKEEDIIQYDRGGYKNSLATYSSKNSGYSTRSTVQFGSLVASN